ncbi:hypothetical protein FHS77_003058 [Paenochrobactrum gallinarii]|uniref:Uncharacterized protein n=1 Tax=Paenochrobactrum gallinarii TaxID=643673 RepID=A0A841LWC3_9HYPH|nr:hypothetical protein [Paenochrobactrum gallinarii]
MFPEHKMRIALSLNNNLFLFFLVFSTFTLPNFAQAQPSGIDNVVWKTSISSAPTPFNPVNLYGGVIRYLTPDNEIIRITVGGSTVELNFSDLVEEAANGWNQQLECSCPRKIGHFYWLIFSAINSRGERYPKALCG